jgi:hypothetical protein
MNPYPILDVLRARVRSPEPFHASRAEVEHLIQRLDRIVLHNTVLSETVALQKVVMEARALARTTDHAPAHTMDQHFPVTGEP